MNEEEKNIVSAKRARLYDAFALLTVFVIVVLDQWTKKLVVEKLLPEKPVPFPVLGHNLAFDYTQNSGAAFSMLKGNALLTVFIIVAVGVVAYFYSRLWNSGSLSYKLVFAMIIGGALGNLIDRFTHGGYVVDFISFRIPEINFYFAIFNVADASICIGVCLLFVLVLFSSVSRTSTVAQKGDTAQEPNSSSNAVDQENDVNQEATVSQEPTCTVNQKESS